MIYFLITVSAVAILTVLYILALRAGNGHQNSFEPFKKKYIAHRGLFDNKTVPENSMAAFKKAIELGYGIELDVRLTADNIPVVFHDATLARMCGDARELNSLTYDELSKLKLIGTDEKIPLFSEALSLINGSVPLIVEIKSNVRSHTVCEKANKLLMQYKGVYCVESFDPFALIWFRKKSPSVLRGQLSTKYTQKNNRPNWLYRTVLTNLLLNFLTRPDFIAYNHNYKNQPSYRLCRKVYDPVNVAWTIRTQVELEQAKDVFEIFIFDSFIPDRTQ